jgi:hypothetical protein
MRKEHPTIRGKNNPNWMGGRSFEKYGISFTKKLKQEIRNRDNNTCRECGKKQKGKELLIHHIDYNKKNNKKNNLISLCNSCHSKTNFQRKEWIKYFKNNIYEFNNRHCCLESGESIKSNRVDRKSNR